MKATVPQRDELGRYMKGYSGNPRGRKRKATGSKWSGELEHGAVLKISIDAANNGLVVKIQHDENH